MEKAGLLAKTRQRGRDSAYLSPAGTSLQDRAYHLRPTCAAFSPSSHCSNHFGFALIKGLAPSGCFFLYTEPATRGRFFFSGIACKSRQSNLQVPTTGRKTLQEEILGAHQHLSQLARGQSLSNTPKLARRKQTNLDALTPRQAGRQVGSPLPAFLGYYLPMDLEISIISTTTQDRFHSQAGQPTPGAKDSVQPPSISLPFPPPPWY